MQRDNNVPHLQQNLSGCFAVEKAEEESTFTQSSGAVFESQVFSTKTTGLMDWTLSPPKDFSIAWFLVMRHKSIFMKKNIHLFVHFIHSFIYLPKLFKCFCLPSHTKTLKKFSGGGKHVNLFLSCNGCSRRGIIRILWQRYV